MRYCERCGGRLFIEPDLYGQRLVCLNCGRGVWLDDRGQPMKQPGLPLVNHMRRREERTAR